MKQTSYLTMVGILACGGCASQDNRCESRNQEFENAMEESIATTTLKNREGLATLSEYIQYLDQARTNCPANTDLITKSDFYRKLEKQYDLRAPVRVK